MVAPISQLLANSLSLGQTKHKNLLLPGSRNEEPAPPEPFLGVGAGSLLFLQCVEVSQFFLNFQLALPVAAKGSPPSQYQRNKDKGVEAKSKNEVKPRLALSDVGEKASNGCPGKVGNHFLKLSLVDLLV